MVLLVQYYLIRYLFPHNVHLKMKMLANPLFSERKEREKRELFEALERQQAEREVIKRYSGTELRSKERCP